MSRSKPLRERLRTLSEDYRVGISCASCRLTVIWNELFVRCYRWRLFCHSVHFRHRKPSGQQKRALNSKALDEHLPFCTPWPSCLYAVVQQRAKDNLGSWARRWTMAKVWRACVCAGLTWIESAASLIPGGAVQDASANGGVARAEAANQTKTPRSCRKPGRDAAAAWSSLGMNGVSVLKSSAFVNHTKRTDRPGPPLRRMTPGNESSRSAPGHHRATKRLHSFQTDGRIHNSRAARTPY